MTENLPKLLELLGSTNPVLQREAITSLSHFPFEDAELRNSLLKNLRSSSWQMRTVTAEALKALINVSTQRHSINFDGQSTKTAEVKNVKFQNLDNLDLRRFVSTYKPLLSCASSHFPNATSSKSSADQRKLVSEHLEVYNIGLTTSNNFIAEEDLNLSKSEVDGEEAKSNFSLEDSQCSVESASDIFERNLYEFIECLFKDLLDPDWQKRHGAALALSKLASCLSSRYLIPLAEQFVIRLLQHLSLDHFIDYISGSNAVAPVRDCAAQALSFIMLNSAIPSELNSKIIVHLTSMLNMKGAEHWHSRFTALLVLRYYFSMCDGSKSDFLSVFQHVLRNLSDEDDEVVSRAVTTLSSLFHNPNIDEKTKEPLMQSTMEKIWNILLDEDKLFELIHDVSSLLTDLLSIIEAWLKANQTAMLNGTQLHALIRLVDAKAVVRSTCILKCLGIVFEKKLARESSNAEVIFPISQQVTFKLIKSLYRCILFASCDTDSKALEQLFNEIFYVLPWVLDNIDEQGFVAILPLAILIKWIACLMHSHKHLKIEDVFQFCIDNPNSSQTSRKEMLCGEEMCSLPEEAQNEALTTRKVVAGRFLGMILFSQFRNASQPTSKFADSAQNIQNCFLPILLSNGLYQRLSAAIVVNSFARSYRKACTESKENKRPSTPNILITCLQPLVLATVKTSYSEVDAAINALTNEINEFQQYCTQRGVPPNELASQDVKDMEEVASIAYQALKKRLTRKVDQESLTVRYNVVLDSIRSARIAHRVNTRRVHMLLVSALLNFGYSSDSFTPILRPLFDATDEYNTALIEEVFTDSFVIVFDLAMTRNAANTISKMLKTLAAGLSHQNTSTPSIGELCDGTIYSLSFLSKSKEKISAKTKNIRFSLKRLCTVYGGKFLEICSQNKQVCCSLDPVNLEQLLVNLEFLSVLHEIFGEQFSSNDIFAPLYDSTATVVDPSSTSRRVPASVLFKHYLIHSDPCVRYRVAHFLAQFTCRNLSAGLNLYYHELEQAAADYANDIARCGAAELLLELSSKEHEILGAVSLLAPLALKMISDPLEAIRVAAADAFGQYVALLALENPSTHTLTGLRAEIAEKYEQSHNFSRVLSCPKELPLVRQEDIPNLREDISLRTYQLEGITWMTYLTNFGLNGILADDMGLGKTLQVLCLLDMEQKKMTNLASNPSPCRDPSKLPASASLIICPKTLIVHWCREWRKYFPTAKRSFVTSNDFLFVSPISSVARDWSPELVLVLSYSEISVLNQLSQFRWNFVILDEGHCIRNPNSQIHKAVTNIVARHRLILSGTPVQNSPADLWALFTYLMPGYLFTKAQFNSMYLNKVMACRNPKANKEQIEESEKALKALHSRVLPFILRRLKSEVLKELPEKIVQDYSCEMTSLQRTLYTFIIRNSTVGSSSSESLKPGSSSKHSFFSPLQTMMLLRKLVDHPALVADDVLPLLGAVATLDDELINAKRQIRLIDYELSGKMAALRELLVECQIGASNADAGSSTDEDVISEPVTKGRQRALIFCQWRSSAALVAKYIKNGDFGENISYLVLDGSVPSSERQDIVDKFNQNEYIDLLILTTQVGGVGLTLTGANIVIFVDHDWNPVVDLQAIDRAHRLGQTRTVNVYRLITEDSVEEKVMNLQNFKTNTSNMLIGSANSSLSAMSKSDLGELFGVKTAESKNPEENDAKRRRILDEETNYSLNMLWDIDSYEDASSIDSFMQNVSEMC